MSLIEYVELYRKAKKIEIDSYIASLDWSNRAAQIRIVFRYGQRPMTDEEFNLKLSQDHDYITCNDKCDKAKQTNLEAIQQREEILRAIQFHPYDIVDENIGFRDLDWKVSYRGFTGLPCPSCKHLGTFSDGKCKEDGTEQYIDSIEKECAAVNFTRGYVAPPPVPVSVPVTRSVYVPPPGVSIALYQSGYSQGYMGAHLPCPGCRGTGSYRNGACFACKYPQYFPDATDKDVIEYRNIELATKCYRGILNLPCPSCYNVGTFMHDTCYVCRFGQHQKMTIKMHIKHFFRKKTASAY